MAAGGGVRRSAGKDFLSVCGRPVHILRPGFRLFVCTSAGRLRLSAAASALTPIEYVEKHNLAPLLNTAINEVARVQPADPVAWLSEWLAKQPKK